MQLAEQTPEAIDFDDVAALASHDVEQVNRLISTSLESDVALVSQVSQYIVTSGGKRLRPLAVLLAARACGSDSAEHIAAAAIIEFIHTATLLHDDVVDGSDSASGRACSRYAAATADCSAEDLLVHGVEFARKLMISPLVMSRLPSAENAGDPACAKPSVTMSSRSLS